MFPSSLSAGSSLIVASIVDGSSFGPSSSSSFVAAADELLESEDGLDEA
jgi:hypothetical protein